MAGETKLYVGNFPNYYDEDQLLSLFQDYEGVTVDKIIKTSTPKIFGFLLCENEDQAAEIIRDMNGIDVGGRKLIIRAGSGKPRPLPSSENQHEANLTRTKYNDTQRISSSNGSKLPPLVPIRYAEEESYSEPQYRESNSDNAYQNVQSTGYDDYTSAGSSSIGDKYFSAENETNQNGAYGSRPSFQQHAGYFDAEEYYDSQEYYDAEEYYEAEEHLGYSDVSHAEYSSSELSDKEYSFLSVANFPFGKTTRDIYKLFSDFNPRKVWMLCNSPHPTNITEAIVCFENPDDATDAIMNIDNTKYCFRTILVTDANDSTIVPELLNFMNRK